MKTLKFLSVIGIAAVILSSCTGKQGTTGHAGATGATCPAGATGPTVQMGNANIQDTNFTVTTWGSVTAYDYAYLSDPQITSGIISNGEVLIFVSFTNGRWTNLVWTSADFPGYSMT